MTTPDDLLRFEDVSIGFRVGRRITPAVRDVSWNLRSGETLAIIGESGSGKSVSAAAILGLIDSPPGVIESGRILFNGIDLLRLPQRERRSINGRQIAMIFQDPLASLNPVFSVGRQIAETLRLHGVPPREANERTIQLLDRVGIVPASQRAHDYPHQFSGGQRQRIMIAMAIAMKPTLLIADEPTSALDVTVQAQILDLLTELRDESGMSIVIITHDISVARRMAHSVVVMHDGQVVESGSIDQIINAPSHAYTRRLLASLPENQPLVSVIANARQPALCEVRSLSKSYRRRGRLMGPRPNDLRAVADVSFEIAPSEIVCLVGESGSGKSSLVNALLRLEPADSGEVFFEGQDVLKMDAAKLFNFRRDVQLVFQDPTASLNPRMRVADLVSEPWAVHRGLVDRSRWTEETEKLLERVGLKAEHATRYPHEFSGGQRQRVAIARALALCPKLIVCDEAVSALDASVQARILDLLRKLREEAQVSILFITHDLALVRGFADRVLVMLDGRIVEHGKVAEIFERPQHAYTRKLLAAHSGMAPPRPLVTLTA